jgi:alpha,alpha-trehalase
MDVESLAEVLKDPKGDGVSRLYLPGDDPASYQYYQQLKDRLECTLVTLPVPITATYVLGLNATPGLLGLGFDDRREPIPYVVPGGRFNEMYGWDSYFIALGLVQDGLVPLAKGMADQLVYQIEHYGAILNANRTYYLTRSQPPFLTSFLRLLADHVQDSRWLVRGLRAAMKEYDKVWMGASRLRDCGLSRYRCSGIGYPPETLSRHYGAVIEPFAQARGVSVAEYTRAYLAREVAPAELDAYFQQDRAVRESGHDTSYRLEGVCTDLCTVDLNSLLYRYETDIANLLDQHFGGALEGYPPATTWRERAHHRQSAMTRLCWRQGLGFFDYDWRRDQATDFVSATNLYPLWAGLATPEQARVMVDNILPGLLEKGGVAGTTLASRGPLGSERTARQWDFPYGWAPHQILLWQGLQNYGYPELAADLALRWTAMLTQCAIDFNGVLAEKYDVVSGSHEVFAEYGNQGAEFRYVPREGFGWTNASYQVGLAALTAQGRAALDGLQASDADSTQS